MGFVPRFQEPGDPSMSNSPTTRATDLASNRRRAAWLYYTHGLTQREVAEHLGTSRSTVIRMLEDARARGEVQITVAPSPQDCGDLEADLEIRFGLSRAIVVPSVSLDTPEQVARGVGTALGAYLNERIADNMVVGIGWGRTLNAMIPNLRQTQLGGTTILSLLGGLTSSPVRNMGDVSWRMAERLGASCLMMPAPLVVDSAHTKRMLIEKCGLDRLFERARSMDLAVISCGETSPGGTSLTEAFLPEDDYAAAVRQGAVADVMCHFIDAAGHTVEVAVSDRIVSVPPDDIAQAAEVVLACGGAHRAHAIRASLLRFGCRTLMTDTAAARALLAL